jgi:transcriptional regulator with PAS, ATPase and Fis domain
MLPCPEAGEIMRPIRSVLWIGSTQSLEENRVTDSPTLDLAWAPDVEGALELPLNCFDGVILDRPNPETLEDDLGRLIDAPDLPPLLVHLPGGDEALARRIGEAGAREVVLADESRERASALDLVERLERSSPLRSTGPPRVDGVIGESPAMRETFALVHRVRRSEATVLLSGETGTGKELLARGIHSGGRRRAGPFVAVNCAAFPDSLLESELFGHLKGAFTGADRDKRGLFETAGGGTLFLDEIGETSGPLQAKLLRVLQEREVRPLGGTRTRRIDVRVIAATNRDLRFEVSNGHFREDLFYRLAVFPIPVPPLRKRPEDVLLLVEHFLRRYGRRERKPGCHVSRDAAHLLLSYSWPGNVRELENEIQRALALSESEGEITPALLSDSITRIIEPVEAVMREGESLHETLERIEAWLLRRALDAHDGHRTRTARRLGITREGLYKKMKRLGIE